MVVNCEQVWQEISNYLEGEVNPELRAAMEAHFHECKHCTAVLDGTRNVIHLYGDDRALQLPAGFTAGWRRRLTEYMPSPRTTALGWLLAAAALALVSGSFALARLEARSVSALRSYHAEPGGGIPDEMMVTVSADSKVFHVPGCRFLHKHENENVRLIAASEAIREGYVPCVRCLRQYLKNQSSGIGRQPWAISSSPSSAFFALTLRPLRSRALTPAGLRDTPLGYPPPCKGILLATSHYLRIE